MKTTISKLADALQVGPSIVLERLGVDKNEIEIVDTSDVATEYQCDKALLESVMKGKDKIFTTRQAIRYLALSSVQKLTKLGFTPFIQGKADEGRRYLKSQLDDTRDIVKMPEPVDGTVRGPVRKGKGNVVALLDDIAKVCQCHPRTILRVLSGEPNPYWAEGHNPEVDVLTLALMLAVDDRVLSNALEGKDVLLTQEQAAAKLKVPMRTFRYRQRSKPEYAPIVSHGHLVRYSKEALIAASK